MNTTYDLLGTIGIALGIALFTIAVIGGTLYYLHRHGRAGETPEERLRRERAEQAELDAHPKVTTLPDAELGGGTGPTEAERAAKEKARRR